MKKDNAMMLQIYHLFKTLKLLLNVQKMKIRFFTELVKIDCYYHV